MEKLIWSFLAPIAVSFIVSWVTTNLRMRQQHQREGKKLLIWKVLSRLQPSHFAPAESIYERVKVVFKDRNEFELCLHEMVKEHLIEYDSHAQGYHLTPSFEEESE